jgi:uncharacterized protein
MSESSAGPVDLPVPVDGSGPDTAGHPDDGTDEARVVGGEPEEPTDDTGDSDPDDDTDDTDGSGEDEAGPVGTPAPQMGDYRMALVAALNVDLPNQHPTVVLRETESPRRQLSFSIGFQDAVVLSHAMRRIPTPRPLTHELMSQVLQGFDIDVVAVRLVGRQGSIYFAELDLRGRNGRSILSCRPSDGLTVALLQPVGVPILIDRRLLEMDGDVIPPGPAEPAP